MPERTDSLTLKAPRMEDYNNDVKGNAMPAAGTPAQGAAWQQNAASLPIESPHSKGRQFFKYLLSVMIIAIIALSILVVYVHVPNAVKPTQTITASTTTPVQLPSSAFNLTASDALYGLPRNVPYMPVQINIWTKVNGTNYTEKTINYALNFTFPVIANSIIVPLNASIGIPAGFSNFSAPVSSQVTVFTFRNDTAAEIFYIESKLAKYRKMNGSIYQTPYGLITNASNPSALAMRANFNESNTSQYASFVFTMEPFYSSTILAKRFILDRNFIIYVTQVGVNGKYKLGYLYNSSNNMLSVLNGYE